MRANFVLTGVWTGIRRNVTMTIALILSTSITLAFVGAAYLASTEISRFKHDYEGQLTASVFLCTKLSAQCGGHVTSEAQKQALVQKLRADPLVKSFKEVSEKDQYDRFIKTAPKDVARLTKVGNLPGSFTVNLTDIKNDFNKFSKKYQGQPGVSTTTNASRSLKTLLDLIDGARLFSILIALVVLIASVLLIINTIQVAAAQRKNETSIMRLVGASRWMTELPFMLETIVATVIGGLISVGLIAAGKQFVLNGLFGNQVERNVIPNLETNDVLVAGGIGLIAGIVLAALTAFATLRLYVRL